MQYKNEDSFAKAVKEGLPGNLFLLYGSEGYLIETWARKLAKAAGGGGSTFNMQRLDGRRPDPDALFEAVEQMPLMAEAKCVLLDDLDLKALPAGGWDKFAAVLEDVAPSCTLVITAKPGVFDAKSAVAKKLVKLCAERGAAVELGSRGAAGLTSFLRAEAKKAGCALSPELAKYMLQSCESGMQLLKNEVAKVCAYAGGGEITRAHIDAVIVPKTEARVFDLSAAILAGSAQRALELLRDLFYLREQPVAIVAVLSMGYADLYRARVARENGRSAADVVEAFGYKGREFRVNKAWNARLSAGALREAIEVLLTCDRQLKSTGIAAEVLLEQTVVKLLAIGSAA